MAYGPDYGWMNGPSCERHRRRACDDLRRAAEESGDPRLRELAQRVVGMLEAAVEELRRK